MKKLSRNCSPTNQRWMIEWMMHLYSALLYIQSAWQSCGGSLLNHHLCAASTWMMRRLPQDNGASAVTSYRWRGERVIEPIKWMGIIRRPWLTRASGGNLARTPGYTPTLYERESGPQFNISSERQCFFDIIVSPSLYWGIRTHTDPRVSTPCLPH